MHKVTLLTGAFVICTSCIGRNLLITERGQEESISKLGNVRGQPQEDSRIALSLFDGGRTLEVRMCAPSPAPTGGRRGWARPPFSVKVSTFKAPSGKRYRFDFPGASFDPTRFVQVEDVPTAPGHTEPTGG